MDKAAAARAIDAFLLALGRDPAKEPELRGTGARVAEAFAAELCRERKRTILVSIDEYHRSWLGLDELVGFADRSRLKAPIQIIASPNDPYIPFAAIEGLGRDIRAVRWVEHAYGHFPYSVDGRALLPLIESFEQQPWAGEYTSRPLGEAPNQLISQ